MITSSYRLVTSLLLNSEVIAFFPVDTHLLVRTSRTMVEAHGDCRWEGILEAGLSVHRSLFEDVPEAPDRADYILGGVLYLSPHILN
jgi:hypothetical protein